MAQTIGFGVLGAGLISPMHLMAIREAKGAKSVAVCDLSKERADKIAAQFGVKAYYKLEDMLADGQIQAVTVATPNHLHHDVVIMAAKAGRHILTEKPPAMSLRETDDMIAACNQQNVKLGCFVQCRTRKAIQAMKQAIDSGRFGKLLHADAYMKWYRPDTYYKSDGWRSSQKSGSGVTVAQAFHYIDLLVYLAGPAKRVEAKMTNLGHTDVPLEDTTIAFINFQRGTQGILQASTAFWPGTDIRIEINGTDGTAIMCGEKMTCWKFRDERPEDESIRQFGSASQATGAGGAADLGYYDHMVVIEDLVDSIYSGREVSIPVSSVRPTLEMVLAMYKSAKLKSPVELPITDEDSIW
jgi:UDP-N-acetyl-2-amino-2-deoxyglucuronate dehydrogenase